MQALRQYLLYLTLILRKWDHNISYIFTRWWYSLSGWIDLSDDTEKLSVQLFH